MTEKYNNLKPVIIHNILLVIKVNIFLIFLSFNVLNYYYNRVKKQNKKTLGYKRCPQRLLVKTVLIIKLKVLSHKRLLSRSLIKLYF